MNQRSDRTLRRSRWPSLAVYVLVLLSLGSGTLSPESLPGELALHENPVVLAAVGSRGARALIRERLSGMGLREGLEWWAVA